MPNQFPAQINQNRFMFTARNVSSSGSPVYYDVIDGGGAMNSAGFVSSCSGQVVGQVKWDYVMARWSFELDEKAPNFDPNQASAGAADVLQIKNFIATLASPTVVAPFQQ